MLDTDALRLFLLDLHRLLGLDDNDLLQPHSLLCCRLLARGHRLLFGFRLLRGTTAAADNEAKDKRDHKVDVDGDEEWQPESCTRRGFLVFVLE